MIRTTPDPVFAAAARDELERRVRLSRPESTVSFRAARARRPWVMELAAVAGVLVLVGGVVAGVHALRPPVDPGDGPVGSITRTAAPAPTPDPAATPSGTPTAATTTPPPATTPPPTSTTSIPTSVPTRAVTPTPPTATTPPPGSSSTLVGPTGARQRTSAEIRTWALSIGNSAVWAEQAVLDTRCMASKGFLYDPEFVYSSGIAAEHAGLTDAQYQAFQDAYYGPQTSAPYDWRTAGCHGRSVHETGQDDAN